MSNVELSNGTLLIFNFLPACPILSLLSRVLYLLSDGPSLFSFRPCTLMAASVCLVIEYGPVTGDTIPVLRTPSPVRARHPSQATTTRGETRTRGPYRSGEPPFLREGVDRVHIGVGASCVVAYHIFSHDTPCFHVWMGFTLMTDSFMAPEMRSKEQRYVLRSSNVFFLRRRRDR
jgi:hypothetical protein